MLSAHTTFHSPSMQMWPVWTLCTRSSQSLEVRHEGPGVSLIHQYCMLCVTEAKHSMDSSHMLG